LRNKNTPKNSFIDRFSTVNELFR